ncbi:MAG: hypothetical protein EOS34_21790 [Mesorhizobium sp.]|nr:MAG: hypothetical protein EOS34_21790 [Mesorhizobium sp.]
MSVDVKMQLTNAPDAKEFPLIEVAMHSHRLLRYMPAAGKDKNVAFQYYLWNCAISESFYMTINFAEIVCRNAIHNALLFRLKDKWYDDATFRKIIHPRYLSELNAAIADEALEHGNKMTPHHVASSLTFGFWEHLVTKRFERLLWSKGIGHNFPGAHYSKKRQDLHDLMESVRRWRNRIAHHRAIFDKDPTRKHQDTVELIKWVCGSTGTWITANSKVPAAIALRPKP